ncbi:failed axon connections homolog isoform X1 [Folsomia candida]|nr:failed axon connections homolog isoform X1 [Folsomia candida]
MVCSSCTAVWLGALAVAVYFIYKFIQGRLAQNKLDRWNNTPKDLVILHGFEAAKTMPNASPFVLKVQTYLRMANIPHKMDYADAMGPKGKAPWISINSQHIADSELIIDFLRKKFEKNLNGKYTEKEIAIASTVNVMLNEHFLWGVALERWVYGPSSRLAKVFDIPFPIRVMIGRTVNKRAKGQGMGLHTESEAVHLASKDLRYVSTILGSNKFICGDEPCELDAGIFSQLAMALWGVPDSPYEKLMNGELKNLKEYCLRMKERYWSDWDQILAKK